MLHEVKIPMTWIKTEYIYIYLTYSSFVEQIQRNDRNVSLPVCKDVVVADEPMFPNEELPKGAEGGAACNV